jgi:hypothetical protein
LARSASTPTCFAWSCGPATTSAHLYSGRVDDASQEVAYKLQRPFVALYEIRLSTYSDREYEGRWHLVGARCSDDQVVDRLVRGLLEGDAQDATLVAKFGSVVADEEVREVAHCHLPLERHPAAAGRVRTCRVHGRGVLSVSRTLLVVGAFHRQISSKGNHHYAAALACAWLRLWKQRSIR